MKTPIGEFDLGIAFGIHERYEINMIAVFNLFKPDKLNYELLGTS